MLFVQSLIGILAILFIAWLLSEDRKRIDQRSLWIGLAIQILLALAITRLEIMRTPFIWLGRGVAALKEATLAGTSFVYGYVGGGDLPFLLKPGASSFIFAFQALPMVMVVGALSMLLFHWGILPWLVRGFSWALQRTMRIGGALGVCAAAKIFLGPTEAPLLIRPYLRSFSRSELFTVMTCGMATTSGTVLGLYSMILEHTIPNAIGHVLTASIISIPGAITLSRIIVPQNGETTSGKLEKPYSFANAMDAIFRGTSDGLQMFVNVTAMIVVMIALVTLLNLTLGLLPSVGDHAISLERILGFLLAPLTWLMGVPWHEAQTAGNLLGTKIVLNEVIAFMAMAKLTAEQLSPISGLIMTYALCGFANFGSLGILIGGLSTLVPEQRAPIIQLGSRALIAGALATCLSGTVIGLLARL